MTIHSLSANKVTDPITQVRIDLAAALRLAVLHELEEGIDNHFTVTVPGYEDRYLTLPFGLHWSEATASNLIVFDESGKTLEGAGFVELSAHCIHTPIHRITGTRVVMHTHQTWALALNMLTNNRLIPASQTAVSLCDRIAYDDDYAGAAVSLVEGERLASLVCGHDVVFMKNHGVLVVGETVAQAYKRLYRLERACRSQVLAMSTQSALAPISEEVIKQVKSLVPHDRFSPADRDRLYLDAMMRVLDRELPGYAS